MDYAVVECDPEVVCPTVLNYIGMGLNLLLPFLFVLYAMRRGRALGLQSDALQSLTDISQLFKIHLQFRGSDTLSQNFWQEYLVLRQKFGDGLLHGLLFVHPAVTVLLACQSLAGVNVYSRFWFWVWISFGFHVILLCKYPWLHWWRGVPVSYILGTLHLCGFILPVDGLSKQQIMLSNAPCMMGLILVSPSGGLTVSVLGSAFYSGFAMYSFAYAAGEAYIDLPSYIWWQCSLGFGILCMGSCLNVLYLSNTVLAGIRRKAELAEHEAVSSLLSLVCDAVVELDNDGAIMSQADRLFNILLMNASASVSSMPSGLPLQNFLHGQQDKELFEDLMQQASTTKNAQVRHMGMRDSMGSLVKMEVFLLSFAKGGSSRYLIGIREHSDYEHKVAGSGIRVHSDNSQDSKERVSLTGIKEHGDYEPDMPEMLSKERAKPDIEKAPSFSAQGRSGSGPLGPHMFPTSSGARADEANSEYSDVSEQSHRSRAEERFLEGMMPTNSRAVDVSLISVMTSWRLATRGRRPTCCAFHEATRELKQACRRFHTRPCLSSFRQETGYQCPVCGIEDAVDPNGECVICERIELLYPSLLENRDTAAAAREPLAAREPEPLAARAPRHRGRDPQLSGGGESDANRLAL